MSRRYDYLVVGAGLFGATFAYKAKQAGKRCLVIDKRPHLGGNIYCENIEGINVHKYGAHIFHTSNKEVWDLVNSIVEFNRYTNSPVANYKGKLYNLPFNMNTFYEDGDEVVSIWKPRPEYQGWIDTLHGGIQAVLMDEICAWVILRKLQTTGVTSKMETRYRKSIDTKDSHIVLRASIKEVKRNIVIVEAKLYNKDGEVCTESVCTYFTFSKEKSKDEMHFSKCDVESEEILPLI